jgi:hypothetical protein
MIRQLLAVAWAVCAATAGAASFTVTSLADSGSGSLREAIGLANATVEADTITFNVSGTIVLTSGQLIITGPVTITGPGIGGPGSAHVTIDGNASNRIFLIQDVTPPPCPAAPTTANFLVTMSGMTLRNAHRNTDNTGGAISSFHSLALSNMVIRDNEAKAGAGISFLVQYPNQSLTVTGSTFTNNIAKPKSSPVTGTHAGAAIRIAENCADAYISPVPVSIAASVFNANSVQPAPGGNAGQGGAITTFSHADITIADSMFFSNAVVIPSPPVAGLGYNGGAISGRARSLTIERSEISGNSANNGSALQFFNDAAHLQTPQGAMTVDIVNSTITNNTAVGSRTVSINHNVAVSIANSTIARNNAAPNRTAGITFSTGPTVPPTAQNALPGTLEIVSSILWNGNASNFDLTKDVASIPGPMTVQASNSIIGTVCGAACGALITLSGTANQIGVDPQLGPLAFNAGPTRTRALQLGSPAMGMGSNPLALATDQRGAGFPRVQGTQPDVGAFEYIFPVNCDVFTDVAGNTTFCPNVAWLKNREITTGCTSQTLYCPGLPVVRSAMAAFMNRLGNALTGIQIVGKTQSGALDIDTDPLICQTTDFAAGNFARRAKVDGVLSALAGGMDVGMALNASVSFDQGTTWADILANPGRKHLRANRWHSLVLLGHLDVPAGSTVRFALHVDRTGLAGGNQIADSHCHLRVRLDNSSGVSSF